MSELSMYDIPKVSIEEVVDKMSRLYEAVIKEQRSFKELPSPFLWGPPGVGKSEAVYELAEELRNKTGKKVIVTDIRLELFSPIDLRGVPVADAAREFTVWLKPKILDMDPSDEVVNLLFLDELSSAPLQVQAAAYQITLDRKIGEHIFPDNVLIIGAGNRSVDRSVSYRMPLALANRMMHYEVKTEFESWRRWAMKAHIHPWVVGYLSFDRRRLCEEELEAEQTAFPSPRSWTFVSNLLWILKDESIEGLFAEIAACIGSSEAAEFLEWVKLDGTLPDVEDIFKGKKADYPKSQDALYRLLSSMVALAEKKEREGKLLKEELDNVAEYVSKIPEDYKTCLYTALERTEGIKEKLKDVRLYREWMEQMENRRW